MRRFVTLGLLLGSLLITAVPLRAEEKLSPVLTAVNSTTISGYVDTSAHWGFTTSWQAPSQQSAGFRGWWQRFVMWWSTTHFAGHFRGT